nr:copia protein [Tanacetum cinerariifolium]
MHDEFEMSMMGELNFFLGLQIKQMEDDLFFNQSKYIKEMLKKLGLEDSKSMKTPMSSDTKLTKDEECESVDSTKYHNMIGCCLTSWFSKKQADLAISTTEAEYVSAEKTRQQALWMKQALIDYEIQLDDVLIMCDNKGAIDLSKNPVQHSRTKHIEIRHHFLRDNLQRGKISIKKVSSEDNVVDILTKPLKHKSFNYLRLGLGMMEHISCSSKIFKSSSTSKQSFIGYYLSLSPINSLDNMFETPSPPSPPPPPQPPLMGHPVYFNFIDYHRAHCLCCFHNRNLILSLRDEMYFMFSHIEFLLTFVNASPSPPHH